MADPTKNELKELAKEAAQEVLSDEKKGKEFHGKCGKCGQMFSACKGEHAVIIVRPEDTQFRRYFQGIFINGIAYKNRCTVPAASAYEILAAVNRWEHSEREMRMGKERTIDAGIYG